MALTTSYVKIVPEIDLVSELDVPWRPDAGTPTPIVWSGPQQTIVIFNASDKANGERVVLSFEVCLGLYFGYPNDEALPGHPLYERGLGYYGLYEVTESSWLAQLRKQNQTAFPDVQWPSGPIRHFVVTFHDETFECLAPEMAGRFTNESALDVLSPLIGSIR